MQSICQLARRAVGEARGKVQRTMGKHIKAASSFVERQSDRVTLSDATDSFFAVT